MAATTGPRLRSSVTSTAGTTFGASRRNSATGAPTNTGLHGAPTDRPTRARYRHLYQPAGSNHGSIKPGQLRPSQFLRGGGVFIPSHVFSVRSTTSGRIRAGLRTVAVAGVVLRGPSEMLRASTLPTADVFGPRLLSVLAGCSADLCGTGWRRVTRDCTITRGA